MISKFKLILPNIKRFTLYSSFGIVSALIGFLTIPYLTRVLTPDDFGMVGIFLSILQFIVPLLSISSEGLVGIKKIDLKTSQYQLFVNEYISLILVVSFFSFLTCLLLVAVTDGYLLFLLILPVVALLQAFSRLHYIELVQDRKPIYYGCYTTLNAFTLLGLTFIFISVVDMDWSGRVVAILLTEMLLFCIRYKFTFISFHNYKFRLTRSFVKDAAKYGAPLMLMLVASWVLNESDRFIVLSYISLSDVGIYTAAYGLGLAINILNNAMTNTVVPIIYTLLKEGRGRNKLRKLNIYYSIFIFVVSMVGSLFFYHFGALILGEEFDKGVSVTCIILVAFGFNGMYRTVGLPLDYLKMNKLKTVNFYCAAILNVCLSIYLIDSYGFLAPAMGTLVSFIVLFFLTLYFNIKYTAYLSD